ncbi:MAG: carboxymuconolactone decarboxylase family protein [Caulobacterales bacterium]|nr:carboxymuconolactone decarboxylase family protein [Caulobacterales bacterium]
MARLTPLPDDQLPELEGQMGEIFKGMAASVGFVPNSFKTMARRPEQMKAVAALCMVMYSTSILPRDLVAMISHIASKASGCAYCQAHTFDDMLRMAGVSKQKLDDLWVFDRSDAFTAKEKAALQVALGGGAAPNAVTDGDFDELKQHFTEAEIVEIVGWIALFGYLNRWNDTLATTLEAPPIAASSQGLEQKGWNAGKHG